MEPNTPATPIPEDDTPLAETDTTSAADVATIRTPSSATMPLDDAPKTPVPTNAVETNDKSAKQDPRPRITLPGPNRMMSDVATELGQLLAPFGIFLFGGEPAILNESIGAFESVKAAWFRTWIEDYLIPVNVTDKGTEEKTMSSSDAGSILLSGQFRQQLREVERLHTVPLPIMRDDGRIELLQEGYDRQSKILTVGGITYATDMKLDEAKAVIRGVLKEFPFADDGPSMAIAVAAMLTVYGLALLPSKTLVPTFVYEGNQPGLGKGLLANLAILPVLGYVPTGVFPRDDAEMRRLLLATAREGRQVVFFDNVTGRLASQSLESFITTSMVSGRVLGTSVTLNCRKKSVVLITGNGLTLSPDMARRTLVSNLFLAESPADRQLDDLLDETRLLELRPLILASLYAFVREWEAAGEPPPSKVNMNFPAWSKVIGAIVEHAGFGCVRQTQATAQESPREVDMERLVNVLLEKHQTEAVGFIRLLQLAVELGLFADILPSNLKDVGRATNTAMGRLFTSYHGRTFKDGSKFACIGDGHARRYAMRRPEKPLDPVS